MDIFKIVDDKIIKAFKRMSLKDDEDLVKNLEGLDIENANEVLEQLNNLPAYFARVSWLYNELKNKKEEIERKKNILYNIIWEWANDYLYEKNKDSGKTANNATPTSKSIESFIDSAILSKKKCELFGPNYRKVVKNYKLIIRELNKVEKRLSVVKVVKESWDKKDNSLKMMINLIVAMMNHKLFVFKDKEGFTRR